MVGRKLSTALRAITLALTGAALLAAPAAADPVIAAAGDIACGSNSTGASCREMATSDIFTLGSPNFQGAVDAVLPLGDVQYECGELNNFNLNDPANPNRGYGKSWGRAFDKTHPAIGNHEYRNGSTTSCLPQGPGAPGYFTYFGSRGSPLDTNCTASCKGYYSYDLGSWHLIALNSNCGSLGVGGCGATSAQGKWLASDLAATTKPCVLAYWHHPRYSSGGRQTSSVQPLWQLLYDAHADVVMVGHEHNYERFAKLGRGTSSSVEPTADANGIREFVSGTGGRNHTGFTTIRQLSEVRDATTFGVLELTLHPSSYDWRFLHEAGKTFTDSGTTTCNAKGGVTPPPDTTKPTVSVTAPASGSTVSGTQTVSASASDNVGVSGVQFKLDGANLGAEDTTAPYSTSWDTTTATNTTHTLTAVARDAAGNTATSTAVSVTVNNTTTPPPPPPAGVSLVRQATASLSAAGTTLTVPLSGTGTAGDALVAAIAVNSGATGGASAVADDTGTAWTKGPVGFVSGSNATRIELWYRANAPGNITSVTVTLGASKLAAANVSEWSGIVTLAPLDASAGGGNSTAATTAVTPSLATASAKTLVVGAITYPSPASPLRTATLIGTDFTPLQSFPSTGTTYNGRAAYRVVSAAGTYQASWTLSSAAINGGAILALKAA